MNTCVGCGEDISHKRAGAKWCSGKCRVKNVRKPYLPRDKVRGTCETCGSEFEGVKGKRFCSRYCGSTVRDQSGQYDGGRREYMCEYQAINKRKKISEATKRRIFERDKYICQICGELCDGVELRDPRMPSIDHVTPWIQTQDDSDKNLQTAHLACNRRRRWAN